MTVEPNVLLRLQFLVRVVRKECQHLTTTDQRLFGGLFTLEQAAHLEENPDLAERVEAFVGRFGRLQDTVGDKLLPLLLAALGEKSSAAIDNLDRTERLGLIKSADEWMTMRNLKVFKNGNSQAVRIPAEYAYERSDIDVEVERIGDEIRIRPARRNLG